MFGCRKTGDRNELGTAMKIESEITCATCSIAVDSVVTLLGAFFTGPATGIVRDSEGAFYLLDNGDNLLKKYGSDGKFVRQIGRLGAGPGEYELVSNTLAGPDGTIQLVDAGLARVSTFSADGKSIGSVRTPVVAMSNGLQAVRLPGDRILVNSRPRPSALANPNAPANSKAGPAVEHVLYTVDRQGVATPLPGEAPRSDFAQWWRHLRLLWTRPSGEILIADPYEFTIDVYGADLSRKSSYRRVADWIPSKAPQVEPADGTFDQPFAPRLMAMWEDGSGVLWLYTVVPHKSWKPGPPLAASANIKREEFRRLGSRPRIETIIEAIDLERGQVIARRRIDGPLGLAFGSGYISKSLDSGSSSEPSVQISRITLRR
jgi:hypothetical protein